MEPSSTLFLICDLQARFRPVIYGFEHVVATTNKVLKIAKILGCEVVVTTQKSKVLGPTDPAVETILKERPAVKSIVLMGIESHICILQTALALVAHPVKYTTYVLADGISSANPGEVPLALAQMRVAGVVVTTSESLSFGLIRDASSPEFKAFSNVIKEEKDATAKAIEVLLSGSDKETPI